MNWRRIGVWCLIPLSLASLLTAAWRFWPQPRATLYSLYREHGRTQALDSLTGYAETQSDHFDLYYTEADRQNARLVLTTAEALYDPVVQSLGYRPNERAPLILYPDRAELRSAFGWGNGESALGVYWKGTIRLLSPNAWIDEPNEAQRRKAFQRVNPIAHELTHYLLDHMTNGNYPHWFSEGLAQRVERQITGYLWIERSSTLRQDLYALPELRDRFDSLSNQPLAYRQSYLLVEYMAQVGGEESLTHLLQKLADGLPFEKAIAQTYGRPVDQLFADFQGWVKANLEQLEEER